MRDTRSMRRCRRSSVIHPRGSDSCLVHFGTDASFYSLNGSSALHEILAGFGGG